MDNFETENNNIDKEETSDIENNESASEVTDVRNGSELSKFEKRRRKRAVQASKALFRTIDLVFDLAQNSCPYVKKQDAERIEIINDVIYDENNPVICKFDLYRTASDSAQPAVILIHGGGFSAGDKKYRRGQAQFLALNGFTVFCLNYGLSPDFLFPDPYKHIVSAANYIYGKREEYNILGDKILAAGDSAGAYYAAMLSANNCSDVLAREFGVNPDFKICGALLNCGVYSLDVILNTKFLLDLDDGVFLSFIGMRKDELNGFRHKDYCMPYNLVNANFPPSFLIYSDHDLFCKGQSPAMIERLDSFGVYNEYYAARNVTSNHCFSLGWRGEDAMVANQLMLSFAKRLVRDKIKI